MEYYYHNGIKAWISVRTQGSLHVPQIHVADLLSYIIREPKKELRNGFRGISYFTISLHMSPYVIFAKRTFKEITTLIYCITNEAYMHAACNTIALPI